MNGQLVQMKPCPSWCTGTHDTPDGECVHGSPPAILIVNSEPVKLRIEAYVKSSAENPPPGLITWSFRGSAAPSLTAEEAEASVMILGSLIGQLAKAEPAPSPANDRLTEGGPGGTRR
jgi:hypothetical protein